MSLDTTPTDRATDRFHHEAVFYDGPEHLAEHVVGFVREGVRRGEPVMVAMRPDHLELLERVLGADRTGVEMVDMGAIGRNPARIIPAWQRFLNESGTAGPVRAVGEPAWSDRRPAELDECRLHEALLNLAFDDGPAWQLVCPHDVRSLPRELLEDARRTHPTTNEGPGGSLHYEGHGLAREEFAASLTPPPSFAHRFSFGYDDLVGLRGIVGRLARQAGLDVERTQDLVLAAHELATNSVTHGGGGGELSAWTEPGAFIVDVRDSGVIDDPLVGREVTHALDEAGRGVWMANQLCDLVQVRSHAGGTDVRLLDWI